jgi:predicted MPP superfamily phosphohydrolase
MTELYPVFFATIMFAILSGVAILFLRLLNRRWWRKRWIKRSAFILPVFGMISIVVWTMGLFALNKTVMIIGSAVTALLLVLILALLLSLPVSGMFNIIYDWSEKRGRRDEKKKASATPSKAESECAIPRRKFLKTAAAVAPVAAISSGISGVAHAFMDVKVEKRRIYYENLAPELEGFKILHLSDIHIGYYTWLEHVETLLERAKNFEPDLILATGDLSDRLDVYGDLLNLFDQFKAPLGTFASIGNHEYFRGFRQVLDIFGKGPVPLLLNEGTIISKDGQDIYLGGADDPRYLSMLAGDFYQKTIDRTLSSAPADAFKILLSHRPEGFDYAARVGVDLTLSGHHHGTQVGFNGRSIFESVMPAKYLWGQYERGGSRLYTSAGVGHWFPFRLGCPAEAPVLELTSVASD